MIMVEFTLKRNIAFHALFELNKIFNTLYIGRRYRRNIGEIVCG